ncbi:hypothetical protein ACLK1S_23715 [Escherichia coli]
MGGVWVKNCGPMARTVSLISLYCAFTKLDEARFVVNRIKTWQDNGGALAECAILYRSNAQSRVLEGHGCRPVCRTVFTAGCASSNARIQDALSNCA